MTRLRTRAVIAGPPDEVFGLYMDLDRRSEWNPSARGLLEQTGELNQPGSRYVFDTRFGPFEVHLLRVEPPSLVELREGVGRWGEALVKMRFEPAPGGRTLLTVESTFDHPGLRGRLIAPLAAFFARLYGRIELRRFRAAAESGSRRAQAEG